MKQSNNVAKQYNFTHDFSYDPDLAQIWLDDFSSHEDQKEVCYFGRDNDYMVIFANEAIMNAPYYKISHLRKMTKHQLFDLCEQYELLSYFHSEWGFIDNTKDMLINELMDYCTNEHYYKYHFEQVSWHDLESDFIIRGYSQGDAKAVKLVSDKKNKFDYEITSDHLENLFYNQPLYLHFNVHENGEEILDINAHDFMKNTYNFDKNEVIECLKKEYANEEFLNALCFYVENNVEDYPSF